MKLTKIVKVIKYVMSNLTYNSLEINTFFKAFESAESYVVEIDDSMETGLIKHVVMYQYIFGEG